VLWQGCWNRFLAMGHIKLLDCEREWIVVFFFFWTFSFSPVAIVT
jgi:hypothetical protein